ncbi:hypothetical protein R1flu_004568 [Riccia fluitans]|uniref:Guanylate cyclase domain-containing protein n=1 Tax=Riccia fluitans TaxID=41844 RepID=A0ABD1YRN6_9MARC
METEKVEPASVSPHSSSLEDEYKRQQTTGKAANFRGRLSLDAPLSAEENGSDGIKRDRQRRMSTGMVYKSPESLKFTDEEAPEDEVSKWEDWQDFASGDDDGSEAVASESESQNLLEYLEPYVPHLLYHSVLYDPETQLGKSPTSHAFFGGVMIADISGFTTLTERALTSKRGTELVEELLVALNNYFSQACDIVLMFGGDIVNVQGSSFIASVDRSPCLRDIMSSNIEATALLSHAFTAVSTFNFQVPNVTYIYSSMLEMQ